MIMKYNWIEPNAEELAVVEEYCTLLENAEDEQCFHASMISSGRDYDSGCKRCAYGLQLQHIIDTDLASDMVEDGWVLDYEDEDGTISWTGREWVENEWEARVVGALAVPVGNYPRTVASMNDDYRFSFKEIARHIRQGMASGHLFEAGRYDVFNVADKEWGSHEGEWA